ncbi:MFS transporter [Aquibium oceanicum]|nr:MFS transporter [Aquibium oceanicum]
MLLMAGAILANGAAGLLYVWSLFILPIEASLGLGRADLGLISSLALISFTAGASVMPAILARIGRIGVACIAFALIAGGHLVFGLWPSWTALALGYGLGFGAGSGAAYAFALSLAASLPAQVRAVAIGVALGAFALSGILLPVTLGGWIAAAAPESAFLRIGIVVLLVGLFCVLAVLASGASRRDHEAQTVAATAPSIDRPFLVLATIFFMLCFIGLAMISHAAAIAASAGIATPGYAASALTLGYLAGSILGAPIAERLGERPALMALGVLALLGTLAMFSASPALFFAGAAIVGVTFGGSGSIMPVLLGMRYGAEHISRLYGRAIIAYGLAGLIAPDVAGRLFDRSQSYAPTIGLCVVFAFTAIVAPLLLERSSRGR